MTEERVMNLREKMVEARVMNLREKMVEVRKRCGYVQKESVMEVGGGRKANYASAEAVLNKVRAALDELGVATQNSVSLIGHSFDPESGYTVAAVQMRLMFVDTATGETMVAEGLGGGKDKGDKAIMKANTAAIKYAVAAALMISWGDDPEASSPEEAGEKPKAKRGGGRKAKDTLDAEAILEALKGESPDLVAIKQDIKTKLTKGSKPYDTCVAAYVARDKEINGGSN